MVSQQGSQCFLAVRTGRGSTLRVPVVTLLVAHVGDTATEGAHPVDTPEWLDAAERERQPHADGLREEEVARPAGRDDRGVELRAVDSLREERGEGTEAPTVDAGDLHRRPSLPVPVRRGVGRGVPQDRLIGLDGERAPVPFEPFETRGRLVLGEEFVQRHLAAVRPLSTRHHEGRPSAVDAAPERRDGCVLGRPPGLWRVEFGGHCMASGGSSAGPLA